MSLSETASGVLMLINSGACDADLSAINSALIARLNGLRARANRIAVNQFRQGQLVEFTGFDGASAHMNGGIALIESITYAGTRGGKVHLKMQESRGKYFDGSRLWCRPANLKPYNRKSAGWDVVEVPNPSSFTDLPMLGDGDDD